MQRRLEELRQQAAVIKSAGYIRHPADCEISSTLINGETQYWWCSKTQKDKPFQWMQISEAQFKKLHHLLKNGQALYRIEEQIAFAESWLAKQKS